ncbi:LOW QUALITY PROTEIN: uncharacterized protein PPP1R15 [Drosophila tropicalis]|uniref:LOW QUALITY PROTEIN: uncharacterized protein PPP1R15 n=1 Tax=Drosophila tropicalis TaxID=46794 RepID=UPI0035AC0BD0
MSIFYNLMGTFFDFLLLAVQLLTNMSSPIYEHYHCAPPRGPARSLWNRKQKEKVGKTESESSKTSDVDHCAEPLATMISLQMMAMDVIDQIQVQEALHQCATSQSSPKPKTTPTAGIEMKAFPPVGHPHSVTSIDLQPQSIPLCKGIQDKDDFENAISHSQRSNDSNNNANAEAARRLHRQRSISECSEDSFICFEEDVDENGTMTSNGWCDDADDNDPERDADDDYDDDEDDDTTDELCDCDDISTKSPKKVRFNLVPDVHVMRTWNFAYRAARKGDWQVYSRDRDRFQQRINRLAPILSTVLSSKHREKVYNERFSK